MEDVHFAEMPIGIAILLSLVVLNMLVLGLYPGRLQLESGGVPGSFYPKVVL